MTKFFALCLALLVSVAASAQEAPDALVRRVTQEVLEVVSKDKDIQSGSTQEAIALVNQKVLPHFNFRRMTALAVGKEWKRATPEQQQHLIAEFRTLLVRTYSNALTSYRNEKVVFKPLKMNPGDTEVLMRVEVNQSGGKPVQLDYSLEKIDGNWKVFDVVVAGISLVTNYRDQFAREVRNGGIDGLIRSIAAKNQSLQAKAVKK